MKDQIVVVTGAGSGIGRATALLAAQRGARVAACDVDDGRLATLASELGDRAHVIRRVDVSDRAQVAAFADAIETVDVLVNNAGVGLGGEFVDTSLDDWDWVLGVNLRGVVHGCHYFVPKMIARKHGHVVNVSSIFGIYAAPSSSAYVATKFAVRGLSLSLRAELAPHGIGVTAICPGMIATNIIENGRIAGDGDRKQRAAKMFRERGLAPEKVAAAILDASRSNPAVRTVGRDARVIASLARVAPRTLERIAARLQRRLG